MEGISQLNEAAPLVTTNTESNDAVRDDAISSTTSEKIFDRFSVAESCDAEADFLEAQLRISSVPGERITENVEDIVQDLENLLEESAHDFRFESRMESCSEVNSTNTAKENLERDLELQFSSHEVTSVSPNLSTDAPASETRLEDSSAKQNNFHTSDKNKNMETYIESIIQNDDFVDSTQTIVENTSQHTHLIHAAPTTTVEEDSTPASDNIENSNLINDPDQNQNETLIEPKLTAQVSEEIVNPDHDTKTELRQPLMVEVEESFNKVSGNEENIAGIKPEYQNQSEKVTENVHSILKIYDPADVIADTTCVPQKDCPSTSAPQPHASSLSPLKITLQSLKNPSNAIYNSKITIKPIPRAEESILKSVLEDKLDISKAFSEHRKLFQSNLDYSPKSNKPKSEEQDKPVKLTIKPVLKQPDQERSSPKITFKPILKPTDQPPSEDKPTKITIKAIPKLEEIDSYQGGRNSPKITIKPLRKPEETHTKITIKPISYNEVEDQKQSPKITIKPVLKSQEDFESAIDNQRRAFIKSFRQNDHEIYTESHSPKITIKPVLKPEEYSDHKITIKSLLQSDIHYNEERHSPKITIKPIRHPDDLQITLEDPNAKLHIKRNDDDDKTPRITIKPVLKPTEECSVSSSRITLKPIHKSMDYQYSDDQAQGPFKLNIKPIQRSSDSSLSPKVTIKPVIKQEPLQMELIDFEDQIKQERIVLKIPKNRKNEMERVSKIKVKLSKEQGTAHILPTKRLSTDVMEHEPKYIKKEPFSDLPRGLVANVLPETLTMQNLKDVNIKKLNERPEDDIVDPLAEIPVYEITLESAIPKTIQPPAITIPPAPRKRGRPRKVPLVVREEFKDPKDERTVVDSFESARPKRSCRGPSVRTTLGIRGRKPRGGATRGRVGRPPGSKSKKDRRTYNRKIKDPTLDFKNFDVRHGEFKHAPLPIDSGHNVVIYEEETRMSAENSSRAHTPAKQVLTSEAIDESQSSIQSNTTTESGEKLQKIRKGPRLEVHQEPEGEVISADKLAEYSWGGGGPYMLQEQVAQFLGIKSFKRKYPGIQRRPVDMQERDFIRESCLASEAMCDMGLTAVKSEDILDIMYTDFQNKYEEYCKHQRDRQAKDVSNKQKALSLAASQEKTKMDIVEQALQSAAQWNGNFNKARKEQRRACLDLQTFTVHYPKGRMKQINKPLLGMYPLALVPGQYSDYYRKYSPMELSKLPMNTIGHKIISAYQDTEDSQSDASGSDSDSSSSDSDSSYSGSSVEDCNMCSPIAPGTKKIVVY